MLLAWDVGARSSLVLAAGIVVLLAGLSLVGAAEDAISGFPVTATVRAFEVVTLTAGIVVETDIQGGLAALVAASAVGLALAAGIALGEHLGRPVRHERDRYDERVRRRAMTAD